MGYQQINTYEQKEKKKQKKKNVNTNKNKLNFVLILPYTWGTLYAWEIIRKIWLGFNDVNLLNQVKDLDYKYQQSFWELINYFQSYNQVSGETFTSILNGFPNQIRYILTHQKIVTKFDKEIRAFLMANYLAAELLVKLCNALLLRNSRLVAFHYAACRSLSQYF